MAEQSFDFRTDPQLSLFPIYRGKRKEERKTEQNIPPQPTSVGAQESSLARLSYGSRLKDKGCSRPISVAVIKALNQKHFRGGKG